MGRGTDESGGELKIVISIIALPRKIAVGQGRYSISTSVL